MAATVPEPWYVQTAQIVFYLTPLMVFIATGIVAAWRFNVFRTAKPSIRIDLEITSRASSDSWTAISAVAMITNTSRVMAGCNSLQWEVRVLAPYNDEDVEYKMEEYARHQVTDGPRVEFPWNVEHLIRNYNPGIALEPGESNVVDMSVAIPRWIRAVEVRCTLVLFKGNRGPVYVWTSLRPHDILQEAENGKGAE